MKATKREYMRIWRARNLEHRREYHRTYMKKWRKANTEKVQIYGRKIEYGLSKEQYNYLLKQQNKQCAICKQQTTLVVDHDHVTKYIRGLLCAPCNKALGFARDNSHTLQNMIYYLESRRGPEEVLFEAA